MRNRTNSRARDTKGSVFVEFALGFILFLILILAVFEGGRLVWTYTTLSHATRAGARYAMVHGKRNPVNDSAIETRVKDNAVGIPNGDVTVATVWEDSAKSGGSVVRITASYPITFFASPLVFGQSSMNMNVTARATVAD